MRWGSCRGKQKFERPSGSLWCWPCLLCVGCRCTSWTAWRCLRVEPTSSQLTWPSSLATPTRQSIRSCTRTAMPSSLPHSAVSFVYRSDHRCHHLTVLTRRPSTQMSSSFFFPSVDTSRLKPGFHSNAIACVACVRKPQETQALALARFSRNKRKRQPIGMLGRSSGNHDWLLANPSLAFLAVFVYTTHATQVIAFEWKPGFMQIEMRVRIKIMGFKMLSCFSF